MVAAPTQRSTTSHCSRGERLGICMRTHTHTADSGRKEGCARVCIHKTSLRHLWRQPKKDTRPPACPLSRHTQPGGPLMVGSSAPTPLADQSPSQVCFAGCSRGSSGVGFVCKPGPRCRPAVLTWPLSSQQWHLSFLSPPLQLLATPRPRA